MIKAKSRTRANLAGGAAYLLIIVLIFSAPFFLWKWFDKWFDDYCFGGELIVAARRAHWETVRRCLKEGSDPNACDDRGRTALMWASNRAPADIVEFLLRKGADPGHNDYSWGSSAVDYARNRPDDEDKRKILLLLKEAQDRTPTPSN